MPNKIKRRPKKSIFEGVPIPVTQLVDGGYLTYRYGSKPKSMNNWQIAKSELFGLTTGSLMCLDSPQSVRKERYPDYKSHRSQNLTPEKIETRERVKRIRKELTDSKELRTLEIDGFEADDIIALACYGSIKLATPLMIIGVDKDLLQIPRRLMRLFNPSNNEFVSLENYTRRQPKSLDGLITHRWQILLCLSILGDKSDDVPKLSPPRQFQFIQDLLKRPAGESFKIAYSHYGDAFAENLWLTMLPNPMMFEVEPPLSDLPALCDEWSLNNNFGLNFHPVYEEYLQETCRPIVPGSFIVQKSLSRIKTNRETLIPADEYVETALPASGLIDWSSQDPQLLTDYVASMAAMNVIDTQIEELLADTKDKVKVLKDKKSGIKKKAEELQSTLIQSTNDWAKETGFFGKVENAPFSVIRQKVLSTIVDQDELESYLKKNRVTEVLSLDESQRNQALEILLKYLPESLHVDLDRLFNAVKGKSWTHKAVAWLSVVPKSQNDFKALQEYLPDESLVEQILKEGDEDE